MMPPPPPPLPPAVGKRPGSGAWDDPRFLRKSENSLEERVEKLEDWAEEKDEEWGNVVGALSRIETSLSKSTTEREVRSAREEERQKILVEEAERKKKIDEETARLRKEKAEILAMQLQRIGKWTAIAGAIGGFLAAAIVVLKILSFLSGKSPLP